MLRPPYLLLLAFLAAPSLAASSDPFVQWVPSGWKVIAKNEGDLNRDGIDDVILVTEETNPANFKKKPEGSLGPDILNLSPLRLITLLQSSSGLKETLSRDDLLPSANVEDKLLLIKTSWGGKSLAVDFRPPSSVGSGVGSPASTTIPDQTGAYYIEMVRRIKLVLSDVKKYYPDYDGKGYEVVGFGWHQGWNDRIDTSYVAQYEANLANLIRDLRKDLDLPNMLVVVGNTGLAWADKDTNGRNLVNAQNNVADPIKYPKFAGNVSTVDTCPFHCPDTSPEIGFVHHWNYSGESYFKVGESMGTAMLKLMKP